MKSFENKNGLIHMVYGVGLIRFTGITKSNLLSANSYYLLLLDNKTFILNFFQFVLYIIMYCYIQTYIHTILIFTVEYPAFFFFFWCVRANSYLICTHF